MVAIIVRTLANRNSFTHFNEKDGFHFAGIVSVLADNQGRHWFGGDTGLFRFDGKSFVEARKNSAWAELCNSEFKT